MRTLNPIGRSVFWLLTALWVATVVIVPTIGVWVGSSIAAYLNGPVWAVCAAGLLLFPGLPLLWEAWASARRKTRRGDTVLYFRDRLILRTLAINFAFIAALLWRFPETGFTALSGRGDWMLDHIQHPVADAARPWLFRAADGLEWLYEAAHENAYAELVDQDGLPEDDPTPAPTPSPVIPDESGATRPDPVPGVDGDPGEQPVPDAPSQPVAGVTWPSPAEIHPAIVAMPAPAKQSIASIGAYIQGAEADPAQRVKAIHDFVATHVAYDAVALAEGRYPPQDAPTVLRTGLGVCAGYANLSKAIGDVTGDEIVVVVGDSREQGGQIAGGGHAWNAARIDGGWKLFDATWDAGHVDGATFVRKYKTAYLFPPPDVMGMSHFPDDPAWQLRSDPISRGDFVRQPMMRAAFYAQGFRLLDPRRSQVTVDTSIGIKLDNPTGKFVMATFDGGSGKQDCTVTNGSTVEVLCELPAAGTYHVLLYSSPVRFGTYGSMGEFEVNRR